MLSHAERRQFDAISRRLTADPDIAAATRRAARRARRRAVLRWLAPYWIAALEARYTRRMLGQTG